MNRCLQGAEIPDWMTKRKTTKGPKQRNCSKQLQNDNLPTNDVENTNSTNKGKKFTIRKQTADCSQTNRKDAAKDPETQQNYSS